MRKMTLKEEIDRIHQITYGKTILKEGVFDKIFGSGTNNVTKTTDPKKADLVSDDVNQFFQTLTTAAQTGLKQQNYGSMSFQKEVESMQIGLILLGYQLPQHGVDGLFGPETAQAVAKFTSDNLTKQLTNETAEDVRNTLNQLGYAEKGNELSTGGEITNDLSTIVDQVLSDFKKTNPNVKIIATSGNDRYHKGLGYQSKHTEGKAIDLTLNPYNNETDSAFRKILDSYKSKNANFSYIDEYTNPSGAATGGHFHLQYGAGTPAQGGPQSNQQLNSVEATPQMLGKLVEMLKQRGVKPEELKQYENQPVTTGGGAGFTDLNLDKDEGYKAYSQICQKFIDSKQPNPLGITGDMLATAAKRAFDRYKNFVPAELALSQLALEGGIGNGDVNSRPIRTKNPFNVGNVDSGANVYDSNVQMGINAYYDLIAKDYIGKGKTAKDLLTNFVNKNNERYAAEGNYEENLNRLAGQANRIAQPIAANVKSDTSNLA